MTKYTVMIFIINTVTVITNNTAVIFITVITAMLSFKHDLLHVSLKHQIKSKILTMSNIIAGNGKHMPWL